MAGMTGGRQGAPSTGDGLTRLLVILLPLLMILSTVAAPIATDRTGPSPNSGETALNPDAQATQAEDRASQLVLPPSPALERLGLPADGTPRSAVELSQALTEVTLEPANLPTDTSTLLDLAAPGAEELGDPPSNSLSLPEAVERLTQVLEVGPPTDEERAALERVPPSLEPAIAYLVDALSLSTQLQQQATAGLSPDDRAFLISSAPEVLSGTASDRTTERVRTLAGEVDITKSLAAAKVLTQAVEATRPHLEDAAEQLQAQHAATDPEAPRVPMGPSATQALAGTAEILRERSGTSSKASPDHAPSLESALDQLAARLGATTPEASSQTAAALPTDLSKATGRIVAAYLDTLPTEDQAPPSAEGAARMLDAIDASRPVIQRWSLILSYAPQATWAFSDTSRTAASAGLAADAVDASGSTLASLRVASGLAGRSIETPTWIDDAGLPSPGDALNAWYQAFHPEIPVGERAKAAEDLGEMPEDVRHAITLLLHAQVQADQRAVDVPHPSAKDVERAGLAISSVLAGRDLSPTTAQALQRTLSDLDRSVRSTLEPALILADASDRVQELLEPMARPASHGSDDPLHDLEDPPTPSGDEPGTPESPDPPISGPSDPETPAPSAPPGASDPARDVWFADPSGAIVVTGFQTTEHAPGHQALLIDLGGDDVYRNNAGGAAPSRDQRYAVHVDLAGDDEYNTTASYAQGAVQGETRNEIGGELGGGPVGILVDATGDDTYRAGPISQGAAFGGGVGMLLDDQGNDTYRIDGTFKPQTAFDASGGQGYALQPLGRQADPFLLSIGLLGEGAGFDTYRTTNGLGAAIVYADERASLAQARQATGVLLEQGGVDEYDCTSVCHGLGKWAQHTGFYPTCGPDDAFLGVGCGLGVLVTSGSDTKAPGTKLAQGLFVDASGEDAYLGPRGRNQLPDAVVNTRVEARPLPIHAAVNANASIFLDLAVGDADQDGYVDTAEGVLGYDPGSGGDNPHDNLLAALEPGELLQGPDEDGDCWTDATEERFGTDPTEPRSRPADRFTCEGAPPNGLLLDVSLDLTLGTGPTDETGPMTTPPGVGGDPPLAGGLRTDGMVVPILAIGDGTRSTYTEPYHITVDLGGGDRYEAPVATGRDVFSGQRQPGASMPPPLPLPAVTLDLMGDDRYETEEPSPAYGAATSATYGVLVDLMGDDTYAASTGLGAGLGVGSTGVLLDVLGEDKRTASTVEALGYASPGCQGPADGFPCDDEASTELTGPQSAIATDILAPSLGPTVGLVADAWGSDHTEGPSQAILASPPNGRATAVPGASPVVNPGDGTQAPPDLAAFIDLTWEDTYVLTGERALDVPFETQGYAIRTDASVDQGRIRGAAVFAEAEGWDIYKVRLDNGTLVDISELKNDQFVTWGVPATTGGEEHPGLFADAPGFADLFTRQDAASRFVDALTGNRGRDGQTGTTVERLSGPILSIPRLGIHVGGVSTDTLDIPTRLMIDPAGDDTYRAPVGAALGHTTDQSRPQIDAALALDLAGDDRYETRLDHDRARGEQAAAGNGFDDLIGDTWSLATQGAGVLGVGLHSDLAGHNTFSAELDTGARGIKAFGAAQGAGYLGVGVLHTMGADNRFVVTVTSSQDPEGAPLAAGLSQGAAFGGLGLLLNTAPEGADTYNTVVEPATETRLAYSQGSVACLSIAVIDVEGRCDAEGGSAGDPQSFLDSDNCSIAIILCYDPILTGHVEGSALLLDRGGDDTYHAHPPRESQGGGMVGLLVDLGGRDTFNGHGSASEPRAEGLQGCRAVSREDPASYTPQRIDCAVQDDLDRIVTVLLEPAEVSPRTADTLEAANTMTLEVTLRDPDTCQEPIGNQTLDGTPAVTERACVHVDVESATGQPPQLANVTLWMDRPYDPNDPGPGPVPIASLAGGQRSTYTFDWNASLDPRLVDGDVTLHAVAPVIIGEGTRGADRVEDDPSETPAFSLRDNLDLRLDTPPRVQVTADPAWVQPSDIGPDDPVNIAIDVLGEAAGTHVDLSLDLVAETCTTCTTFHLHNASMPADGPLNVSFNGTGDDWAGLLPPGAYRLTAEAVDRGPWTQRGVAAIPFGLDQVDPTGTLDVDPRQNITTSSPPGFRVAWNASDPLGDLADKPVQLHVSSNGGPWKPWGPPREATGEDRWVGGDGDHLAFRLDVTDAAGNLAQGASQAATQVDLSRPTLSDPRATPTYLRPGVPVTFSVNATEEQGLATSHVLIDGQPYPLSTSQGPGNAGSPDQRFLSYTGWDSVVEDLVQENATNASRPQGYAYRFVVTDLAGNTAATSERTVFIDTIDPLLVDANLSYPRGTAGAPGDLVEVHVEAADNFGIQQVVAEAGNVSSQEERRLTPVPGTRNYTTVLALDDIDTHGAYNLTLRVDDLAGNQEARQIPLRIETRAASVTSFNVTRVTATQATLAWETPRPSAGTVLLVDPSSGREQRFQDEDLATSHELEITGLDPATTYEGTLVPSNQAGRSAAGEAFTLTTGSLIDLATRAPASGDEVAGALKVRWNATTPNQAPLTYNLLFVGEHGTVPAGSTVGEPGEPMVVTLSTDGIPDGVYDLRLEADQILDQNQTLITDLRVDNTPPSVRLLDPPPGGQVANGTVHLRGFVRDPGSGVDTGSVVFIVDGQEHDAHVTEDGTVTATVALPEPGMHEIHLVASDATGNQAADGGPVEADPEAPEVARIQVAGRPGGAIVKPGSTVPIVVEISNGDDADGVIDASRLGLPDAIPLDRVGDQLRSSLQVPTSATEETYRLFANITDQAGHNRGLPLLLTVDRTPPALTLSEPDPLSPGMVEIGVSTDEPSRIRLLAEAPDRPTIQGHQTAATVDTRERLSGLHPGTAYTITVEATDLAGNVATATTPVQTPPDHHAPSGVRSISPTLTPTGAVSLTWTPAVDDIALQHYTVHRIDPDGQTRLIDTSSDTRLVDADVEPGHRYRYRVTPVDLAGNQGPAAEIAATSVQAPTLSNVTVTPDQGGPSTMFSYSAVYTGPDQPTPRLQVVIDDVAYEMERVSDETCEDGCRFTYETELDPVTLRSGPHTYQVRALLDGFAVQHPADGSPQQGPVVSTQADDDLSAPPVAIGVAGVAVALGAIGFGTWRWVLGRDGR